MNGITRRELMRRLLAWGLGATGAGTLLSSISCSSEATSAPTLPPTKPLVVSTRTPTLQPASTASPIPTAEPAPVVQSTPTSEPATVVRSTPTPRPGDAYLAVARGESPAAMVQAALKALGGIERFVKPGHDVIIKPNICVAYHSYEYAATTNPEVVATLVGLCLGAGARRVRVMDLPFGGTPQEAYTRSGIAEAVQAAGGQMEVMARMKYQDVAIPNGRDITRWPVYHDVLAADVLIDVPIAKHHNLARLTLGMKNLMGVVLERSSLHRNLGQRLADLTSLVRPTLTVVDAVRILTNHGPTGGSLDDVKLTNTVIASHDIVAADAYAATLFGLTGADIPAIRAGADMSLGAMDLRRVKVEEINVGG
jgi:uncharacterized protein (DUF362 family)